MDNQTFEIDLDEVSLKLQQHTNLLAEPEVNLICCNCVDDSVWERLH